jgi:hypothetical protein
MRTLICLSLVALTLACSKPADEPLPPSGLAGVGAPSGDPTALPGAGDPGPAPIAQVDGATGLPPGHPPVAPDPAPAANIPPPSSPLTGARPPSPPPPPSDPSAVHLVGSVIETMNASEYTYMRIRPASGVETWAAVPKTRVAVGDIVTVNQSLVMDGFESPSLKRTFDHLVMGMMVGAPQKPGGAIAPPAAPPK